MNYKIIIFFLLLFIFFSIYILYENSHPEKTKIKIYRKLNQGIDYIKILQISDLHNYRFGEKQRRLLKLIDDDYDYIFITGDLIDRRYPDIEKALELIDGLKGKIFFVTGNHEKGYKEYNKLKELLIKREVNILDDKVFIDKNKGINIIGLDDPSEYIDIRKKKEKNESKEIENNLRLLLREIHDDSKLNILLSHRPEFFDLYAKYNIDLVFSGHTHGGHVRLFNRGLFAPDQGIFGKYTGGVFNKGKTTMINSRGLGNNFFLAKRVFNRPHIIELKIYNKFNN